MSDEVEISSVPATLPEPTTTIQALRKGPLIIRGDFALTDVDGARLAEGKDTVALCRCGASGDKPFCDGTHSRIGFDVAEQIVPESAE